MDRTAAAADVLRKQPGLLGDASRPGLHALPRLVTDAEAALQAGHLQLAQSCLETYFAETSRPTKEVKAGTVADQFVVRAHFAAGLLVSKLSSSFKGRQLVDAVLEAVGSIMRGVELAAANPRYSHLVYNGSVHFWHVARPLQCNKLRSHLLPSQEKLCQALNKVEGQQAWRVRHLLSLALCQGSEDGKPEDVPKTLAKALELATAANLQPLRAEVLALQTHHQTQQAAKAAAAKPGGPAGAGGQGPGAPAAPPAPKQAAPAGKRKPGEPAAVGAGKADVDGALALLQWVLSAKPDATAAEQQLQAALKLVDLKPDKPGTDAHLGMVARIGWAAAVFGAPSLAEQCTRRAATSQDLGPRVWADLTGLLLSLKAAPEAALGPGSDSSGSGAALDAAALRARREVLEGADEAASAFLKLGDVEGIHNAAVLAWNAGLPLLQPCHRSLVKLAFTAIGKALEAVGSPWARLRAALHLEVAKAEADSDSFIKAAKEVSTALSLNYPSSADMAAVCGYERPLDRYLEPMVRAAQLRGVAPVSNSGSSAEAAVRPDDDVVLLLERAKDSKSAPLRLEYLHKAVNKLALLPAVPPPNGPASTEALQTQLRAARTRTQLWADVVELAWRPCQLDTIVRSAVPFVLEPDWQPCGDKEMLVVQARVALVGADAAQAALSKLDAELAPPPGYAASRTTSGSTSSAPSGSTGHTATGTDGSNGRASTASQKRGDHAQEASVAQGLQRLVADYLLQGMRLFVAAGGRAWLAVNASMAAWNAYLPLMQKERYADLAGLLLPMLQVLLQEPSNPQHTQLVMLAEAAAKSAEHVALLEFLCLQQQQQQQQQGSTTQPVLQQQSDAGQVQQAAMPSVLPWYKPLAEARAATAGQDLAGLLAGAADVLELLSATAAACQTALTRAATASELQGLIQSYARLQQLQGKPVAVPPGAPAAMADTSKVLGLIEGLTATAPSAGALNANPPAVGAAAGRAASAASAAGGTRGIAAGGKGAPAVPAMSKAEQDIRAAMALLAAMPSVNLQLWSQLSQAAGCHGYWLLARECASAALGALPADKRDLSAVTAASEVPELGAQGWYHLSVAEMQQGQALLSLLLSADNAVAASLSLRHSALQHFATAANLASFIWRADLAEAAARLAYNTVTAPGGLLETPLTRAAAVKALTTVSNALNATRPADISFQVQVNLLLVECLSAAGRWQEARRHTEALHRSLPLSKQKGPAAAAALEAIAGWRATSLVKAAPGAGLQDMPRLLSELSTPQAKARAWLAFAQATPCPAEQLQARQAALAALDTLAPATKVEYQLEFAGWLASTASHLEAAGTPDSEQLLLDAAAALDSLSLLGGSACGARGSTAGSSTAAGPRGAAPGTADSGSVAAAGTAGRKTRATVDGWGASSVVPGGGKRLEQLIRVHMLLAQMAAGADSRQHHLLQAQAHAEQLLTGSMLTAAAEAPPQAPQDAVLDAVAGSASDGVAATSSCGAAPSVSGSGGAVPGVDAAAKQQPPVPALPLPMLTRPGTAASAATATARSTAHTSRGLAQTVQLPGCPLEYAIWEPDAAIVAKMQELAAAAACASSSSSGSQGVASGVGDVSGVVLSRSSMQAPELLLANLKLLSEQLQAAGRQIEALPVLQLARLVALVTLGSEVAAAAVDLDLSCVCDQLGLPAAAGGWLQLAALERWPSPEQLQQAEVSKSMQQLSKGVLQAYYLQHSGRSAQLVADSQAGGSSSTGFLHEALDDVEPATLQSWQRSSCDVSSSSSSSSSSHPAAAGSTVHSTWGSRAGSAPGRSRPASAAAGARTAAAALTAGVQDSLLQSRVGVLQVAPLKPLDSWVSIARYLVEHAQYTAGQRLCGVILELARCSGDVAHEAEVLLLQARMVLLAQHNEDAVKLSQAAQELGGSVQLWRDSVLCYAAARGHMADRGPAGALEALENGTALVGSVARVHGHYFIPTLLEASARLKMHLATELESRSLQQWSESQINASCLQAAARLHGRAVAMCKEAAMDAQQAGAVLLQGEALQQAARLLGGEQGAAIAECQQNMPRQLGSRSGCGQSGSGAGLLGRQAAVLEAVQLLQVAFDALAAVCSDSTGTPQLTLRSRPNSSPTCQYDEPQLPQEAPDVNDSGVCQMPDASLPAARAAASVLVQLSGAELVLARLQLQQRRRGRAAAEPEFPRVEGRNPQAVIAYLSAAAASSQTGLEPASDFLQQALQHAQEAAEAAAAARQPSVHAAALLALGKAHMLQAHAAMLEGDQQQGAAATCRALCSKSGSSGNDGGGSFSDTAWFDAAVRTPWPGQLVCSSSSRGGGGSNPSPAAAGDPADTSSAAACEPAAATPGGAPAPLSAPGAAADAASPDAGADTAANTAGGSEPGSNCQQSETAPPDGSSSSSSRSPTVVHLPLAAQQPLQQAVQALQQALEAALQQQQLPTAEAAARALAHCYGQLQPEQAAFCLAVAQSCSSAVAMRGSFKQAAAPQHAEVLLWRQMQQLEQAAAPGASVHMMQVQQLLALLGITSKRLQVPHPAVLKPLLSQLQHNQRLLLLHHDSHKQQLVLAAWGVPGAQLSAEAQNSLEAAALAASEAAAAAAAAAAASTPGAAVAARASANGGSPSARGGRKSAVAPVAMDPAADAAAAALAAVPPAAILGSMPCTHQQLQHLADAFAAYSRQLQKAIVVASSQPAQTQPADASAAPPAAAAAAAAGVKKPAAAAAGKAAGKDKGARDASAADVSPPWVPPAPVFPPELNEQWQQLVQQFEGLLQPISAILQEALQPQAPLPQALSAQPATKQAKGTSTSGGKALTAAAAAASTQLQPVPTSLQLLLDPALCELPWEALPVVRSSCGSIARCLSLAQLQQLLAPPQTLLGSSQQQVQQQQGSDAAAAAAAAAAATATAAEAGQPVVWDVSSSSYLVDPMHHMSAVSERPGPYAAPLLQTFRQQVLEAWGQEMQGCAGVEGQVPGEEQLLRPLVGSKGLLVLAPGPLLGHVGSQAVAGLDLRGCTAALLLDHLDNPAAAAHHVKADNRKTDAERALQGPAQAALLLMLRGVRSVAVAALPGTPHTHVQLAANIMRALTGTQAVQPLQVAPGSNATAAAAAAGGTSRDPVLLSNWSGPMSVGEAVVAAQRQGLAGFELQAVCEAAVVVYGLAGVVAAADGGGGAGGSRAKARKG